MIIDRVAHPVLIELDKVEQPYFVLSLQLFNTVILVAYYLSFGSMINRYIINKAVFILFSLLSIIACDRLRNSRNRIDRHTHTTTILPAHLDTAEKQAEHLIKHFWDNIDFAQILSQIPPEELEQKIADYLGLILSFPLEKHKTELLYPLEKSNNETLIFFLSTYREYLYEADSPITSDEFYKPILEWAIHTPKLSVAHQEQARLILDRLNLNTTGSISQNFIYTKLDQSRHHLHNQQAPHTLVVFGTPNCSACTNVVQDIQDNKAILKKIQQGDLGILMIYIQCTQEEFADATQMLPNWIEVGYDANEDIIGKPLYDIKASPTIYLINRSGKVVLKDIKPEHLNQITTQI